MRERNWIQAQIYLLLVSILEFEKIINSVDIAPALRLR